MLKKTITYTDYNGIERTESFFFNLTQAELLEMEMGVTGGLGEAMRKIIKVEDYGSLVKTIKDIILKAYGEKSADGKRFIKINDNGVPLHLGFSQTEAFSNLFIELTTNDVAAAEFINGIVPADISKKMENIDPATLLESDN